MPLAGGRSDSYSFSKHAGGTLLLRFFGDNFPMRVRSRALSVSLITLTSAVAAILAAAPAEAACKRMGFLVNDYGKEGPTRDAQELLDKHVAEWAAQNGIKNYTIGKKDVKCELYLNLILFDEHTCTASANVCWDEPGKEKPAKAAKADGEKGSKKAPSADKESSSAESDAKVEKAADTPSGSAPAAPIETGTVAPPESAAPAAPSATAEDDAATRAAAAAERAAEAAERAAAAAEKAAAAAKPAQEAPSQLEMPGYGAGKPADVAPVEPVEPKS